MTLSTRLTMAMVGLVLFAIAVTGILTYRNLLDVAVPRSLQRLGGHVELVAAELQAVVSAARADVLAFAVEQMVNGGSGEIADASNVFAAAERRQLTSRFAAELAAKPWYDEWRIVGAEDGGREIIRVDRSGSGGASRAAPEAELQRDGDQDYFQKTIVLAAGDVYISPIELKQTHGTIGTARVPSMRVAAPLIAADGRRFGIVIADLDLRPVFDRIRATARQGSRIYVVNEAGDFLLHPDPNREFAVERASPARVQDGYPALTELLQGDDATPRVLNDRAGERFGMAWQRVRLGGGPRVAAIEALPYPALIAGATAVRDSGVVAALAAVLVAFVLAVIIARSMTKPLAQMTRAVEGLSQNAPMKVPTRASGEIGVLAKAFACMDADMREKRTEAKKAQEALLDSERMARTIIDTALDAIIQVNECGEVLEWNPRAESILGWSRQEAMGKPITDLYLPKGYRPRYLTMNELLQQVGRVEGERFEIDVVRKDGRKIRAEISMTGVRRHGGNVYNAAAGYQRENVRLGTDAVSLSRSGKAIRHALAAAC
jgi:PAS domain S-box-containing protein